MVACPFDLPVGLVNRFTAKAFNALWYAKSPRHRTGEIQDITQFFHPLDIVGDWNRVYGPKGFCQYQFVVPFGEEAAFTTIVETIAQSGHVSSLNVLKRFGPGNRCSPVVSRWPGGRSRSTCPYAPGSTHCSTTSTSSSWPPVGASTSRRTRASRPRRSPQMYPRLDEFRATRARFDPTHTFRSDLSRRLDL